jgi:hypothetical protein
MANLYNKAGLVNIPIGYSDGFLYNIKPVDDTLAFRFNRDSAATRVNKEGLIEQVGYFGPELVKNGDFSELGPELVTNGDFATDSDWTKGTGWSISSGKANCDGSQTSQTTLESIPNLALGVGNLFKITFDISNYSSGQIDLITLVGTGGPEIQNINANGSYTAYSFGPSGGDNRIQIIANSDFVGSIDNVSVKQVDPNDYWTIQSRWSFGDNKIIGDGTGIFRPTTNSWTSGGKFLFKLKISDRTSGYIRIQNPAVTVYYANNIDENGELEFTFDSIDNTGWSIEAQGGFNGSITDISVTEILGDKPRIDYTDSLTSPSFLLEPQSTNLIPYSKDFSQWGKVNGAVVTDNFTTSPDGTQNAAKVVYDGTSLGRVEIATSASGTNTQSIYLKTVSGTQVVSIGASSSDLTEVTVTSEWQRFTYTGSGSYPRVLCNDAATIYVWGAQLEQGSYATSYIPTAGSTATRTQETCNGAGNASTFNDSEGVLYAEIAALADDGTVRNMAISNGTNNERVLLQYYTSSNVIRAFCASSGSSLNMPHTLTNATDFIKVGFKYKSGDYALWVNGVEVDTKTNTFTPTGLNELAFDNSSGGGQFYGNVKCIAVFNEALTDDELEILTIQ